MEEPSPTNSETLAQNRASSSDERRKGALNFIYLKVQTKQDSLTMEASSSSMIKAIFFFF